MTTPAMAHSLATGAVVAPRPAVVPVPWSRAVGAVTRLADQPRPTKLGSDRRAELTPPRAVPVKPEPRPVNLFVPDVKRESSEDR